MDNAFVVFWVFVTLFWVLIGLSWLLGRQIAEAILID